VGTKSQIALLALVGVLLAAGIGVAAYVVSRDSVGLPVTKLEPSPRDLSPTATRRPAKRRRSTATTTTAPETTTTGETERHRRGGGGDD
jgi:hypothetical protein